MSYWVMTKIAAATLDSFCSFLETEVTSMFIKSSRATSESCVEVFDCGQAVVGTVKIRPSARPMKWTAREEGGVLQVRSFIPGIRIAMFTLRFVSAILVKGLKEKHDRRWGGTYGPPAGG